MYILKSIFLYIKLLLLFSIMYFGFIINIAIIQMKVNEYNIKYMIRVSFSSVIEKIMIRRRLQEYICNVGKYLYKA